MNTPLEESQAFWKLSDELVAASSNDNIVEVARILAFQAPHVTCTFGELPIPELDTLLRAPAFDEDGVAFLRDGTKALVDVLATVTGGGVSDQSRQ